MPIENALKTKMRKNLIGPVHKLLFVNIHMIYFVFITQAYDLKIILFVFSRKNR